MRRPRPALLAVAMLACTGSDADPKPPGQDTGHTGVPVDTGVSSGPCERTASRIQCAHHTERFSDGVEDREVHWQVPSGDPPSGGWPVAVLFQGSGMSAEGFWDAREGSLFGAWWQGQLVSDLLDAGYAVVTPEAKAHGSTFWDTNIPPWSTAWTTSRDHVLMQRIFEAMGQGTLGDLDADARFAAGISSGGYMTSRMAVSYPGRFRALAIQSGSYATCGGAICSVPATLPVDHPPTLFLHGEKDAIVPISTMWPYANGLDDQGTQVQAVVDPQAGHEWLEVAPTQVVGWFDRHR